MGLDRVKCLPLHFSFFVVLIYTKKKKFIQKKIIQYLDLINFIQKNIQLIFKRKFIKYIRNYNKVNKQSKYITKIIQTRERHYKNKHI
jgi:hypothetical protein